MINAKQARLLFKSNIEKELEPLSDLITRTSAAAEAYHIVLPLEHSEYPILKDSIWKHQSEKWFLYAQYMISLGFQIKNTYGTTTISWNLETY